MLLLKDIKKYILEKLNEHLVFIAFGNYFRVFQSINDENIWAYAFIANSYIRRSIINDISA